MTLTISAMQVFVTICSSIGLVFNVTLVIIIYLCSGTGIGNYKYLLLAYTLMAIGSCAIEIAILPMFHPTGHGWLYFSTVDRFNPKFGNVLIMFYCASFVILMQILTLSFFYRYYVICRSPPVDLFHRKHCLLAVLLFMAGCTVFCANMTYQVFPTKNTIVDFDAIAFNATGIPLRKLAHIGGYLYTRGSWWTKGTLAVAGYTVVMFGNMAAIIYCLIRMLLFFDKSTGIPISDSIKAVQKRFLLLLFLQTLVPMIFTFSPVLISYILCFIALDLPQEIHIFYSCFQPIAQLVEPIVIITLLKEYRRAVGKVLRLKSSLS